MNEQKYLENIVTPLLSHTEDLNIERIEDEKGILLTITAHGDDMGRLIGKLGNTANAIRALLRQYGAVTQKHISVKINDPLSSTRVYSQSHGDRKMLEA